MTTSVVSLRGAGFHYPGGDAVLRDIDLEVDRGDFLGIVGPSGAGKTTLLHLVTGTLAPTAGTVDRDGTLAVGYVPQLETVDWNFPITVAECVLMARSGRRVPWTARSERAEVDALLERLGLDGLGDRHIRHLSGGQQQRVFIARALHRRPHLLLLDEPSSGVDVRTRHELLHLLADLHRDEGLGIVLTTHDLNGVAAHLPRLVCVNGGVIAAGRPSEVLTPEVLEATYGAPMEVLVHGGMPVVVDRRQEVGLQVVELPDAAVADEPPVPGVA